MGESAEALLVALATCSVPARAALAITFSSWAGTAELTSTTDVTPAIAWSMLSGMSRLPTAISTPATAIALPSLDPAPGARLWAECTSRPRASATETWQPNCSSAEAEGIAEKELSVLLASGRVIPVAHGTTFEALRDVSPMLASHAGLNTADSSLADVAAKVAAAAAALADDEV